MHGNRPSRRRKRVDNTSSSSTPAASGWQIASASVRGATHERSSAQIRTRCVGGRPRGRIRSLCFVWPTVTVAASTRTAILAPSARSKKPGCCWCVKYCPGFWTAAPMKDLAPVQTTTRTEQLKRDLVRRWRASIYEHATDHRVPEEEKADQKVVPASKGAMALRFWLHSLHLPCISTFSWATVIF